MRAARQTDSAGLCRTPDVVGEGTRTSTWASRSAGRSISLTATESIPPTAAKNSCALRRVRSAASASDHPRVGERGEHGGAAGGGVVGLRRVALEEQPVGGDGAQRLARTTTRLRLAEQSRRAPQPAARSCAPARPRRRTVERHRGGGGSHARSRRGTRARAQCRDRPAPRRGASRDANAARCLPARRAARGRAHHRRWRRGRRAAAAPASRPSRSARRRRTTDARRTDRDFSLRRSVTRGQSSGEVPTTTQCSRPRGTARTYSVSISGRPAGYCGRAATRPAVAPRRANRCRSRWRDRHTGQRTHSMRSATGPAGAGSYCRCYQCLCRFVRYLALSSRTVQAI